MTSGAAQAGSDVSVSNVLARKRFFWLFNGRKPYQAKEFFHPSLIRNFIRNEYKLGWEDINLKKSI